MINMLTVSSGNKISEFMMVDHICLRLSIDLLTQNHLMQKVVSVSTRFHAVSWELFFLFAEEIPN